MADDAEDQSQKTEEPSSKRLEEAVKQGNVLQARELSNFMILLTLTGIVAWMSPWLTKKTKLLALPFLSSPELYAVDMFSLGIILQDLMMGFLLMLALPMTVALAACFTSSFLQHGIIFSWEPVMPKLSKISPISGLKRMFSMRSVVELIKGIIKISVVTLAMYMAVMPEMGQIKQLPDDDAMAMLLILAALCTKLLVAVCICMFFIALLDYLYQYFEYIKSLRMSKQEIKDEYKQQEGDPAVKQRLRQLRADRARKRMMAAVPKADVVITNPTHFAVALQYDMATMKAPKVIAKGIDFMALNIRRIAEEHKITIVRNPPLARTLYDNVEVDAEIKVEHYKAVAEIISYVYKLKGKVFKGVAAG